MNTRTQNIDSQRYHHATKVMMCSIMHKFIYFKLLKYSWHHGSVQKRCLGCLCSNLGEVISIATSLMIKTANRQHSYSLVLYFASGSLTESKIFFKGLMNMLSICLKHFWYRHYSPIYSSCPFSGEHLLFSLVIISRNWTRRINR